jgi:glycosyltransferase involved in cell wall biosynthesis
VVTSIRAGRTLVIQIPCHNEEEVLPRVLADLPTSIPGIARIITLVIDDGSTDRTAEIARARGAQVLRLPVQRGLARAFLAGLDRAVALDADVVVNTDGDHQYRGSDIALLVAPVLDGRADIVVGARPVETIASFSLVKKLLQRLGSFATRVASGTKIADAPSGFRAMSAEAAMRLHVFNRFTYTVETIIQAGRKGMTVLSVPVGVNPVTRPSRLARGSGSYVLRQLNVLLRVFVTYKPFRFFAIPGITSFALGSALLLRFLYFYFTDGGAGHIQSVVIGAMLAAVGLFLVVVGLLADLIAVNRQLLEDVEWRLRRMERAGMTGAIDEVDEIDAVEEVEEIEEVEEVDEADSVLEEDDATDSPYR